ncbi:MAG: hypothetical protein KC432_03990, partial [Thermomicrobiales bacterium]|nr:hypothetical protein [Thermomicrobiales bacterium]
LQGDILQVPRSNGRCAVAAGHTPPAPRCVVATIRWMHAVAPFNIHKPVIYIKYQRRITIDTHLVCVIHKGSSNPVRQ